MKYSAIVFIVCSILSLTACNKELTVRKLSNVDDQPRKGIPYNLMYNKYMLTVSRGIVSCTKVLTRDDAGNPISKVPDVRAFVKVDVETEAVDDGDHIYLIEPDSFSGAAQISELAVTLTNGRRLKSINAKSDDQTLEIATSLVSGIGKLAVSSIVPVPAISTPADGAEQAAPPLVPVIVCTDLVKLALTNVKAMEQKIQTASNQVSTLGEKIAALKEEMTSQGDTSSTDCTSSNNEQHAKCKLEKAYIGLRKLKGVLAEAQQQMQDSMSKISEQEVIRWPDSSSISQTKANEPLRISKSQVEKWVTETKRNDVKNVKPSQQSIEEFRKEFDLHLKIGPTGSYGVKNLEAYTGGETIQRIPSGCNPESDSNCEEFNTAGIRYRVPAGGYLLACRKKQCERGSDFAIVEKTEDILQLGHVFYIPFRNGMFGNRELSMTFDDNGALSTAKIIQKEAPGENAAKLFGTVAEQVAAYRKAKLEADPPKSELQVLQDQVKMLEAQKSLADAEKALNPSLTASQLNDLMVQTELAKAQKMYLEAIKALESVEEPEESEQAKAVLNSETSLLLAQIAKLEAELKIRELQALSEP